MARKKHPHKRAIQALESNVVTTADLVTVYSSRQELRKLGLAWWLKKGGSKCTTL